MMKLFHDASCTLSQESSQQSRQDITSFVDTESLKSSVDRYTCTLFKHECKILINVTCTYNLPLLSLICPKVLPANAP